MVLLSTLQNDTPKRFSRMVAVGILAVLTLIPANGMGADILLGTDADGTFSHFAGRVVCRLLNRHASGLDCRVVPGTGGVHNLTNLQGGSLDIAIVADSLVYEAVNNRGGFQFLDIRYDNLADLTPLYTLAFLLVAREDAGIDTLDQLAGKRLNLGISRSATRQVVDLIVGAKGWTMDDFPMVQALPSSLGQDTMAFCHGNVQAMFHIGVHPDSTLEKLINLCGAKLVSMDDTDIVNLIDTHPGYTRVQIPMKTYAAVAAPITTFGTPVSLVASGSLDDETAETILATLDRHRQVLKNAHPAMSGFAVGRLAPADIGLSLHPGAAAYRARQ